jgi:hypothetical protein
MNEQFFTFKFAAIFVAAIFVAAIFFCSSPSLRFLFDPYATINQQSFLLNTATRRVFF